MGAKMALFTSVLYTFASLAAAEKAYQPVNTISMPVYTVINDALKDAFPIVHGKANEPLMRLICDLARGDKRQDDIDLILTRNKVNIDSIPTHGNPLSLLVNHDRIQQKKACAAWFATSLRSSVNLQPYQEKIQHDAIEKEPKNKKWSFWFSGNKVNTKTKTDAVIWNKEKFYEQAIAQMALAKATAQFYALIANDLRQKPIYSFYELKTYMDNSINSYSTEYLNAIKINYASLMRSGVEVKDLSANYFKIVDSQGTVLTKNNNNAQLSYQDIPWLGEGKIMGKDYFVDINLSSDPVAGGAPK
ncbi:hypothetical protein [Enterobacter ludwigii]|uniref:hypothetical protein n=1 Tax=Enterobacter ludwigii TaxID=299767 RepID=UPI003F72E301